MNASILSLAQKVVTQLKEQHLFITTVESCTGGGIANGLTNISGASEIITGARVVYSAEEKQAIGIPPNLTTPATIYSTETAIAMARAGLHQAIRADVAVGVTGQLSFPDPHQKNRAYLAVIFGEKIQTEEVNFSKNLQRWEAKDLLIEKALSLILQTIPEEI